MAIPSSGSRMPPERRSGEERRHIQDETGSSDIQVVPDGEPGEDRRGPTRRLADRVVEEIESGLRHLGRPAGPPSEESSEEASEEAFDETMRVTGAILAETYKLQPDEIALLLLVDRGTMLKFIYPVELRRGNMNVFPAAGASIAGQVLRTRMGRIDNEATHIMHLSFYEKIRLDDRPCQEIQKMMSVPLHLSQGQIIGVVQVSRKAESPETAGPDFTPVDLARLVDVGRRLGGLIRQFIPASFWSD